MSVIFGTKMESQKQKIFLNPVMSAPWKPQTYENPIYDLSKFPKSKPIKKINTKALIAKTNRHRNIEILTTRFPGLKKYQARAALTISKNVLEKAIVLLEVSNCYRTEFMGRKIDNAANLKNIHINVEYNCKQQDPTLRNVNFKSSVAGQFDTNIYRQRLEESVDKENVPPVATTQKLGVVITKTLSGYKATPLSEKNKM